MRGKTAESSAVRRGRPALRWLPALVARFSGRGALRGLPDDGPGEPATASRRRPAGPRSPQDLVTDLLAIDGEEYPWCVARWLAAEAITLEQEPALTGNRVIDALVAAATEAAATARGRAAPLWTQDLVFRVLDVWWHPGPPESFDRAVTHSPPPFRKRLLAIEEASLRRG